jgi:tellurite resistance protein TerC
MPEQFWAFAGFITLILVLLSVDLGVFHREAHVVTFKEALGWSAVWISLGLSFSIFVYFAYENHWLGLGLGKPVAAEVVHHESGAVQGEDSPAEVHGDHHGGEQKELSGLDAVLLYLNGYIVEETLSVDNIFVMILIIGFFRVPSIYQHRVLFWGILGALVMRGVMITVGAALVHRFEWILLIFGAFLVFTAYKLLFAGDGHSDPGQSWVVRMTRKIIPVTSNFHLDRFFVRASAETAESKNVPWEDPVPDAAVQATKPGALMITPLFLALIMIETTDLIFAVDSIPAIFGITTDPFLVFTSNVFAILGLRSMYFALAGIMDKFGYLKYSLAAILAMIGLKMLFQTTIKLMAQSWSTNDAGVLKKLLGESLGASTYSITSNLSVITLVLTVLFLAAGVIASLMFGGSQDTGDKEVAAAKH